MKFIVDYLLHPISSSELSKLSMKRNKHGNWIFTEEYTNTETKELDTN